jgi:hypothetical protein
MVEGKKERKDRMENGAKKDGNVRKRGGRKERLCGAV